MTKDELNDLLLNIEDLSKEKRTAKERLKLLLPHKKEMEELLKNNPKWVSFISPIEKDLFYRFYPEKEKWICTDFQIAWYYALLANAYMDLGNVDGFLENAYKAHGLDPTCTALAMNIITAIDHYEKEEYYTRSFAMLLSLPKYSTNRTEMANYLCIYGFHLLNRGCHEVALACFYLSNQFVPDIELQEHIKGLSKLTSYSKATSAKNIKLYSKRYHFETGFSKEVKDFVLECATSCLANKDKDAFVYYLEILTDMDEAYLPDLKKARQGKKTSLVPNPNPIKVCYHEMTIQKEVDVIQTVHDVREYLKSAKQRVTKLKNEGISLKDAVEETSKNLETNSLTSYFYLYCLYHFYNLEVPENILAELNKNHESKDLNQYEAIAKEYGKTIRECSSPFELDTNIGTLVSFYFFKNMPIDMLGLSFYFSGYSIEPSYLMKAKSTQKKSILFLFNEKGEKFEFSYIEKKDRFSLTKNED